MDWDISFWATIIIALKEKKDAHLAAISLRPALGTMRLIARKMLYVRSVGQCLQSLHKLTSTWQKKINIPHYSDSQCHFCVAW